MGDFDIVSIIVNPFWVDEIVEPIKGQIIEELYALGDAKGFIA